jgi:hypothetical protein
MNNRTQRADPIIRSPGDEDCRATQPMTRPAPGGGNQGLFKDCAVVGR